MDMLDLFTIAERYLELINPTSPEKVIAAGRHAGMAPGLRIIDFGCGYGEPLVLWGREFGITGVGIDVREHCVARARQKMIKYGLADRIEIVHAKGAEYPAEKHAYDLAVCLGASFVWNGFEPAVQALKEMIKPSGRILIGEPYWKTTAVPPELVTREKVQPEWELADIVHRHGLDILYLIRSSDDDWARYEAANWEGLIAWLEENPDHPEKREVIEWLRRVQDEHFRCIREYVGFAIYILNPIRYL
jgi:SAM-dependent methyltransferase